MFIHTMRYWVSYTHHEALYNKKSNLLHNSISHSWLDLYSCTQFKSQFFIPCELEENIFCIHSNETHWTNIKIYRPQYTDFALYGHCGRYKLIPGCSREVHYTNYTSELHFFTAVCTALFQNEHFTRTMRGSELRVMSLEIKMDSCIACIQKLLHQMENLCWILH